MVLKLIVPIMIVLGLLLTTSIIYFNRRMKKLSQANDAIGIRKLQLTRVLIFTGIGFLFLLLFVGSIVHIENPTSGLLKNLAATIIIGWLILLVLYYAWAIYFYNVNLGWSDDKWNRFRASQREGSAGNASTPNQNPHAEETLGLQPGTVRGTIALTLLISAAALVLSSLNEDVFLKNNSALAGHFDFLKDAFLMMIAFYFGAKSLDVLKGSETATASTTTTEARKVENALNEREQRELEPNFKVPGAEG